MIIEEVLDLVPSSHCHQVGEEGGQIKPSRNIITLGSATIGIITTCNLVVYCLPECNQDSIKVYQCRYYISNNGQHGPKT